MFNSFTYSNGSPGGIRTHISRFKGVLPGVLETLFLPLEYGAVSSLYVKVYIKTLVCSDQCINIMAGAVGFEPTHVRVRAGCLTVWLSPNMMNGGGGGIRTHGSLRISGFQDRRTRPGYATPPYNQLL